MFLLLNTKIETERDAVVQNKIAQVSFSMKDTVFSLLTQYFPDIPNMLFTLHN